MAINSASLQHQYKDYVNPWDLNIFASILQNKQQKYDQGAASIQQKLDGFASLDVLADSDKQYLNSKINETVKGINSLGGADLSDSSVISQLSGHVGNIGQDDRIINAVLDTKKIRTLQAGRSQINKDFNAGKKGVYRSDANEYFENQNINKYLEAKKADPTARYDGPMNPISYSDYHKRFADAAKTIKANTTPYFSPTDNKRMYMLKTGESVSEERVMEMAATSLTEEDRGQMARDGQYHYKNASDEQILDEFNITNKRRIAQLDSQINNVSAIYGVEAPQAKERLLKEKDMYVKDLDSRKASMQKILTSDRASAINQVFTNRYTEGLVSRYAYKKETFKPIFDQAGMQQDRLTQQAAIANQHLAMQENQLMAKIANDKAGNTLELEKFKLAAQKEGMDVTDDGRLIQGTGSHSGSVSFVTPSMPGDTQINTEDLLKAENEQIKVAKEKSTTSFYNEYAKKVDDDGSNGLFQRVGNNYVPTEKWKKANVALEQAAQDIINGKPTRLSSLPKEFVAYKEQRKALELLQTSNQDKINSMRSTAWDNTRANLKATNTMSDSDWQLYLKGQEVFNRIPNTPKKMVAFGEFGDTHEATINNRNESINAVPAKDRAAYEMFVKHSGRVQPIFDKEMSNISLEESKQLNHIGTTFTKKELQNAGLMNGLLAQSNGYYVLNGQNGIESKPEEEGREPLTSGNFEPIGRVRSKMDGTERNYVMGNLTTGSGEDKSTKRIMLPIDDKTASSIDAFASSPAAHINRAIETSPTKTIKDISYGMPRGGRVDAAADFKVIQLSEGRHIIKVKQPYGADGKPLSEPMWVELPKEYATASEAHQNGKQVVPFFQQAYDVYKKNKKNLSFRDYILHRAQTE